MVSFQLYLAYYMYLRSGPHFWNSGAFSRVTAIFARCQQRDRQLLSTEFDHRKLITLLAAICLPHPSEGIFSHYYYAPAP